MLRPVYCPNELFLAVFVGITEPRSQDSNASGITLANIPSQKRSRCGGCYMRELTTNFLQLALIILGLLTVAVSTAALLQWLGR